MKRSDVSTAVVLRAVDAHGAGAWDVLCRQFPAKLVLAAIMREVEAGRLNYGVWAGRPWMEPKGQAWLLDHPQEIGTTESPRLNEPANGAG